MIEAGEEESILGQIPVTASFLQLTKADWQYTTTPQGKRACLLMKNNRYLSLFLKKIANFKNTLLYKDVLGQMGNRWGVPLPLIT